MKIWFDMDGTIADLYGVENWLSQLRNEDDTPYAIAKPLLNMSLLARYLNKAMRAGHEIGIVSCTSKGGSAPYNAQVALTKIRWLHKHLPTVAWNEIKIINHGTNKFEATGGGILFDDEQRNRDQWGDGAYDPADIISVLKRLVA